MALACPRFSPPRGAGSPCPQSAPRVRPAAGPGPLAHQPRSSPHGPRPGEPDVGPPLRPGPRPDHGELRPVGRAAHASGAARLAGHRVRPHRLEHEGHAPADGPLDGLSAVVGDRPEDPGRRPRESPPGLVAAAADRGRGRSATASSPSPASSTASDSAPPPRSRRATTARSRRPTTRKATGGASTSSSGGASTSRSWTCSTPR